MPKKAIKSENILDLIRGNIKKESNFEKILDDIVYEKLDPDGNGIIDKSTRGFYYERFWDLCIKFGLTDLTLKPSNTNFTTHVFGNTNKDDIKHLREFWKNNGGFNKYLSENIRSGNSGGYSDITFLNKNMESEELYLISVKYYEKAKSIACYDVDKLCALQDKHKNDKRKIHIYLFVKDKSEAIKKWKKQNISSDLLIDRINPNGNYENLYDMNDLHKYYFQLRELLLQYNYLESDNDIHDFEISYLKVIKSPFIPRFHQKLFIDKVNHLLIKENKSDVLVGAIPRSGKSYIMAGIILEYTANYDRGNPDGPKLNFIMITPAPNETFGEYTDIFEQYIDFQNKNITYKVFNRKNDYKSLSKDKHNIIIVSKQKLGWSDPGKEGQEKSEIIDRNIKKMFGDIIGNIELMFLDEAHYCMTTSKSMEIFKILQNFGKVPKIYVTATYNKPLKIWGITEDCKLTWDINDVNIMKNITEISINDNPIKNRFGESIYNSVLEWRGDKTGKQLVNNLVKEYSIFPKPHLITSIWHSDKLNIEKKKIGETNYGFDMAKLFMTKNKSFENPDQVREILRYYFGKPDPEMNYGDSFNFYKRDGIIPRIKNICSGKCRTMQEGHITTQLWFLPVGTGELNDKITALLEILLNSEFRKLDYHYFTYVNDKKGISPDKYVTYMIDSHNIKKEIEDTENKIREGKVNGKNLIILSGNRLQLGISLRNVDIVTMWNSITSTDAIFQMLFRSMTEVNGTDCVEGEFCKQKKYGFMVDLNPQRAMTNVNLFSENISYKDNTDNNIAEYRQIIDLIDIDGDIINSNDNKEEIINELFNKLYESWNKDVEGMKRKMEYFTYSPILLSVIEPALRFIKLSKESKEIIHDPEEKIDSGKKKEKISDSEKKKSEKEKKEIDEIPIEKLAAELIVELISILNIFTLYLDGNVDCILINDKNKNKDIKIISDINKLKEVIFQNPIAKSNFLKILNGRLNGDENTEYSEKIINIIIQSIIDKKDISYMEKVIHSQKKGYYGIKEPDKLLEDINKNLAPKDKERKEKGEVFTPIEVVKDMLDKLPLEVWSNPNLKWLDPAVGIGNFPIVVYLRLMEGLKSSIPEEEDRRKHILEKMIYMVEISEKSIFILNKIFCGVAGGGQYNLNIFKGSFVEGSNYTDPNHPDPVYNPNFGFDIIMGNPPYNQGGVGKGGGVFWKKFVDKSLFRLNDNGYLTMIHPTGWRKPSGERPSAGDIWKEFRKYNLTYLNISDKKIKFFPKVDYYVLNKSSVQTDTHLVNIYENNNYDGFVNLYNLSFIPNFVNKEIISIFNKLITKPGDKFNIIYDQSFKPNKEDKERINGIPHTFYYIPDDKKYYKVYKNYDEGKYPSYIDEKKIVMTAKAGKKQSYLYAKYFDTPIGGTNNTMYQLIDENDNYKNQLYLFNSDLMHFILKLTQYSEPPNYINELKILNMITKPNQGVIADDNDLYNYYGITGQEIELIENIVSASSKPKKTFDYDKYIKVARDKIISLKLEKYKSPSSEYSNLQEFVLHHFDKEKNHLKSLSEKVMKQYINNRYIDNPKQEKKKQEQKLALERKRIREEKKKNKTIKKNADKLYIDNFKQPVEIDPKFISKYKECIEKGKLWNIKTKRCMKDTKANRKKLTIKK